MGSPTPCPGIVFFVLSKKAMGKKDVFHSRAVELASRLRPSDLARMLEQSSPGKLLLSLKPLTLLVDRCLVGVSRSDGFAGGCEDCPSADNKPTCLMLVGAGVQRRSAARGTPERYLSTKQNPPLCPALGRRENSTAKTEQKGGFLSGERGDCSLFCPREARARDGARHMHQSCRTTSVDVRAPWGVGKWLSGYVAASSRGTLTVPMRGRRVSARSLGSGRSEASTVPVRTSSTAYW